MNIVESILSDSDMTERTVYKNGEQLVFNMEKVQTFIETELSGYSNADQNIIKECLAFLVSDLDITDIDMRDTPERFYFDAVKAYLEDGHSIRDLDEIEDDSEVFDYCGI